MFFFRIACGGRPAPSMQAVCVLELIQTGTGMRVLEVGIKFLDSGWKKKVPSLLLDPSDLLNTRDSERKWSTRMVAVFCEDLINWQQAKDEGICIFQNLCPLNIHALLLLFQHLSHFVLVCFDLSRILTDLSVFPLCTNRSWSQQQSLFRLLPWAQCQLRGGS